MQKSLSKLNKQKTDKKTTKILKQLKWLFKKDYSINNKINLWNALI